MPFTIAIIGRPNVGKSTLFNRLTGTKHAIVDDRPGVTRDRREGIGRIAGIEFKLIDTAGLEEASHDALENRMMQQTSMAVDEADICFMLVDGRAGITPDDHYFASWLRKRGKPVILLVNKCEGTQGDTGYNDALSLGFEYIIPISAEHNDGFADVYDSIEPYKAKYDYEYGRLDIKKDDDDNQEKAIQIAIVGRPNAGKSTFINKLIGQERVLTGPEAGITRDSIAIDWQFEGRNVRLIDTAGIRRKSNITGKLEKLSVADSYRAICYAHVAVLMIDALQPLEKQDLSIADMIIKEGRAVVVAVNKWDMVKESDRKELLKEIGLKAEELLPDIKGVTVLPISALKGNNINKIIKSAVEAYDIWDKRVATAALNQWLKKAESRHIPPLASNKTRIRLKYITQGKNRPPTFMLFVNRPKDLPDSYLRYLINSLREEFSLPGIPLRILLRKVDNPYEKRKKKQ